MRRGWMLGVVLVACGGAITSVDANKDMGSLGANDKDQLCRDVASYVTGSFSATDVKRLVCGSSTSYKDASCNANFQKCMADPTRDVAVGGRIDCTSFSKGLASCQGVSVGTFTDCYKQYVDAMRAYTAQMPLCDAASMQAAAFDASQRISSQCLLVIQKCSAGTTVSGGGSSGPISNGGGVDRPPPQSEDAGSNGPPPPPPDGG